MNKTRELHTWEPAISIYEITSLMIYQNKLGEKRCTSRIWELETDLRVKWFKREKIVAKTLDELGHESNFVSDRNSKKPFSSSWKLLLRFVCLFLSLLSWWPLRLSVHRALTIFFSIFSTLAHCHVFHTLLSPLPLLYLCCLHPQALLVFSLTLDLSFLSILSFFPRA